MQKKYNFIYFIILTIFWISFIFYNSSLNAIKSTSESNVITIFLSKIITKIIDTDIIYIQKSISLLVRKTAHFISYFVLMILCFSSFINLKFEIKFIISLSLIFCISIAVTDEFIQLFSKGRSGNIIDVLIDTCGSMSALAIIGIFKNINNKFKIKCLT